MFNGIKRFISHIQQSEEHIRRRWLFVFSGAAMIITVGFWITYLNFIVNPTNSTGETTLSTEPGFTEIFGAGVRVVTNEARKQIGAPREITIEKPYENFQLPPEKLTPTTPTSLP